MFLIYYAGAQHSIDIGYNKCIHVVGDRVYVGSLDTKVYCLDADDGDVKWTFKTEGYIISSPAVVDGVVYVISQEPASGGLYWLNATNGNLIRRKGIPYQEMTRGTDMHSSPTVAEGMIFAASNKKAYYGMNATTGETKWTFKDDEAGEFIICSPIYHDGRVFLIDEFFIVAVDAFNGSRLWQSFLGTEFYISPTYADGKLYVTSDQRGMYVLNTTDGTKLTWFATPANSWSSPTLYEGRLHVGNMDWNVYCLSEYPALSSNITVLLDNSKVVLGESMTGSGRLVPGMANASIVLSFVRPDETVDTVQVATVEKGIFNFTYKPDVVGSWTVSAQWTPTNGYYSSTYSEHVPVEVALAPTLTPTPTPPPPKGLPVEYIIVIAASITVVVPSVAYFYRKRAKK